MIRAAALVNSSRVRFHALLSYPRPVPGMRVAPLAVQGPAACLYRNLCRQAHGPGRQYLYKPLLHWVLAADVRRVIVLDTDVVVLRDISELWAEFGRFGDAMIGVANEQSNLYSGDAIGKNGGVQLLDLANEYRSRPATARAENQKEAGRAAPPAQEGPDAGAAEQVRPQTRTHLADELERGTAAAVDAAAAAAARDGAAVEVLTARARLDALRITASEAPAERRDAAALRPTPSPTGRRGRASPSA